MCHRTHLLSGCTAFHTTEVVAVDFNPDLPLHEAKAVRLGTWHDTTDFWTSMDGAHGAHGAHRALVSRYSAMAEWDGTVYTVGSNAKMINALSKTSSVNI